MRTDAKIGFAIGGVLLAVLTVYAIVVPRHKKAVNTVTLVTPAVPASDGTSSSGGSPADTGSSPSTPPPIAAADNSAATAVPSASAGATLPTATSGMTAGNPSQASPASAAPVTASNSVAQPPDNTVASAASTDGFHPLNAPTDMGRSDDSSASVNQNTGKLVDGVYTPEHSSSKLGKSHRSSSSDNALPDETDSASASTAGDTLYTIKSGQTLSKIAYEVYGNSRFWVVIQRENKGLDANHLRVGSKVKLPDISTVVPGPITVSDEEVAPMMSASTAAPRHHNTIASSGDGRSYTVKSGDSLYAIARRLLGSGRKADALYDLNQEVIGPDKSKLKLGEVLKLPEGVRTAMAD